MNIISNSIAQGMMQKQLGKKQDIQIDRIIASLFDSKESEEPFVLDQVQIAGLCYQAKNIMMKQPNLLELHPPMNVCGDFHGQFGDLKEALISLGIPSQQQNFLFLGDYVDRGKQSLQCICLLLAYKIKYPENFFMLRGNHQCSQLNKIYGFYDQCKRRVGPKVWRTFSDCFNYFPLAAIIGSRIFCVHGGLSPLMEDLTDINSIKRPTQFCRQTMLSDLLWSDPSNSQGWTHNQQRGTSYCFGQNIVQTFLKQNDFDLICRSHQIVEEGYQFVFGRKLLTIFSAPNYCNMFTNKGAALVIDQNMKCHIHQFISQRSYKVSTRKSSSYIAEQQQKQNYYIKRKSRASISNIKSEQILQGIFNQQI